MAVENGLPNTFRISDQILFEEPACYYRLDTSVWWEGQKKNSDFCVSPVVKSPPPKKKKKTTTKALFFRLQKPAEPLLNHLTHHDIIQTGRVPSKAAACQRSFLPSICPSLWHHAETVKTSSALFLAHFMAWKMQPFPPHSWHSFTPWVVDRLTFVTWETDRQLLDFFIYINILFCELYVCLQEKACWKMPSSLSVNGCKSISS